LGHALVGDGRRVNYLGCFIMVELRKTDINFAITSYLLNIHHLSFITVNNASKKVLAESSS
jgi:hypothetical protein